MFLNVAVWAQQSSTHIPQHSARRDKRLRIDYDIVVLSLELLLRDLPLQVAAIVFLLYFIQLLLEMVLLVDLELPVRGGCVDRNRLRSCEAGAHHFLQIFRVLVMFHILVD